MKKVKIIEGLLYIDEILTPPTEELMYQIRMQCEAHQIKTQNDSQHDK